MRWVGWRERHICKLSAYGTTNVCLATVVAQPKYICYNYSPSQPQSVTAAGWIEEDQQVDN